jgi:hypothetical protein
MVNDPTENEKKGKLTAHSYTRSRQARNVAMVSVREAAHVIDDPANGGIVVVGPGVLGNLVAGPCLVKVWTQEPAKLDHVEDDGGVEQHQE